MCILTTNLTKSLKSAIRTWQREKNEIIVSIDNFKVKEYTDTYKIFRHFPVKPRTLSVYSVYGVGVSVFALEIDVFAIQAYIRCARRISKLKHKEHIDR